MSVKGKHTQCHLLLVHLPSEGTVMATFSLATNGERDGLMRAAVPGFLTVLIKPSNYDN